VNQLDLIIRGGTIVAHEGERRADIGVAEGRIVALESDLKASAKEVVDARARHIFPGLTQGVTSGREWKRVHKHWRQVAERCSSTCR
jgi:dihydroorotase